MHILDKYPLLSPKMSRMSMKRISEVMIAPFPEADGDR